VLSFGESQQNRKNRNKQIQRNGWQVLRKTGRSGIFCLNTHDLIFPSSTTTITPNPPVKTLIFHRGQKKLPAGGTQMLLNRIKHRLVSDTSEPDSRCELTKMKQQKENFLSRITGMCPACQLHKHRFPSAQLLPLWCHFWETT